MLLAAVNIGIYLIKGLVWAALLFYLLGLVGWRIRHRHPIWGRRACAFCAAGLVFYLLHALAGFQNFYAWSHEAAWAVMELETFDRIGVRWGGALYLNYLFTALWIGETAWWWFGRAGWERRPAWMAAAIHGFLLLVFLGGMVVFARGPVRWFSLVCLLAALGAWLATRRPAPPAGH